MHIITPKLWNSPLQASEHCFDVMGLFLFNLNIILITKPSPLNEGTLYIHDLSEIV